MLRLDATTKKRYDGKLFKFKKFSIKQAFFNNEIFSSRVKARNHKKNFRFFFAVFLRFLLVLAFFSLGYFYAGGTNFINKKGLFYAKFFEFEEFSIVPFFCSSIQPQHTVCRSPKLTNAPMQMGFKDQLYIKLGLIYVPQNLVDN